MTKIYRYFSQYGEDYLLWSFFDFKPQGFFIDIGAFDGIHLSNSYSFELMGWKGICIEPHPFYYKLCAKNRPESTCINKACGKSEQKDVELHVDNTGLFSSLREIGQDENITEHFGLLNDLEIEIDTIRVDIVPLDSILEEFSPQLPIDYVSIDVEGAEIDVLQGFDLKKFRPRVVVVETNSEKSKTDIDKYMDGSGYIFARRTKANSFYVMSQNDCNKLKEIKYECLIEKQIHPLGKEYTIPSYLNGLVFYKGEGTDIFKKLKSFEVQLSDSIKRRDSLKKKVESLKKQNDSLMEVLGKRDATIQQLRTQLSRTVDARVRKLINKIRR